MQCPRCDKTIDPAAVDKSALPFCSARCKQADLGRWLTERNPLSIPQTPHDEIADTEADDGE